MRVVILLLDSFGIGATKDADKFGDAGSNTFAHIVEYCAEQFKANKRATPLQLPNLAQLGLYAAARDSTNFQSSEKTGDIVGKFGYAEELSHGKDTPSGHWEIAGVPVLFDWGYFPPDYPSFPEALINALVEQNNLTGILGNKHASGTEIIADFGAEHMRTDQPIIYTSADSVFQIAAHEMNFGLDRLYRLCESARTLVDEYNIGRVIARPFLGDPGQFYRTGNRRDYTMPPPSDTLLDFIIKSGGKVFAIGKTADIFAHQGISQEIKAHGNMNIFDETLKILKSAPDHSLIFANFVDFDSVYGHRRDIDGYANALEEFDARLPELEPLLKNDDVVFITADHGCDPTHEGSDHTREHIPVLVFGQNIAAENIGQRKTFADIGQSIAKLFGLPPLKYGTSFL